MSDRNVFPPEAMNLLENLTTNSGDIETLLQQIENNTDELETILGDINLNTDELEAILQDVDDNTDNVEAILNAIDANTDNVETLLSNIITELQGLDSNTDQIEALLQNIINNTDTVESELQDVNSELDTIQTNTDNLEALLNSVISELQDIETDAESINSLLDELEDALASTATDQIRVDIIDEGNVATEATLSSANDFLDAIEDALASTGTDELRVNVVNQPISVDDNGGSLTIDTDGGLIDVSVPEPLSVDDNGGSLTVDSGPNTNAAIKALIITSFERNSMYNENLYSAGSLIEDVADGESTFFYVENPISSLAFIDIDALVIRASGKSIITITQDPTVDTPGAPAQIRNKRTQGTDTSEATITIGGEYSGGDEEEDILLPGGEGEERVGGEATDRFVLIDPGDSVLIELLNDSGRTQDQEIKIKFSEVTI